MNSKILKVIILYFCFLLLFPPVNFLLAQGSGIINTASENNNIKFGPGDFLSFSIKLVNFGSIQRADVTIIYKILSSNNVEVYSSSETVAVDTTASFVKRIALPTVLQSGNYTLETNLTYPGQQQPAVSKFNFVVENKFGGFFVSDLLVYSLVIISILGVLLFITYWFSKRINGNRFSPQNYSNRFPHEIIYYEILSDLIAQMRLRVGNVAIDLAQNIPDLEIDEKTGRIINIKKDPAQIIALLIYRFEEFSGQKMSFSLRPKKKISS